MDDTLELARRHVVEGRKIVFHQRDLLARMKEQGRNTHDAELTLELFEQSWSIFEDHLKALNAR